MNKNQRFILNYLKIVQLSNISQSINASTSQFLDQISRFLNYLHGTSIQTIHQKQDYSDKSKSHLISSLPTPSFPPHQTSSSSQILLYFPHSIYYFKYYTSIFLFSIIHHSLQMSIYCLIT